MFKVDELLRATRGKLINMHSELLVKGISIDTRTIRHKEAFLAIRGAKYDGHSFINEAIRKGATCIIKDSKYKRIKRNSKLAIIEVSDTQEALADIARFQRKRMNLPVIAITGSSGKTTTKDMIAWVLSAKLKVLKNEGTKNNHIGLPLTLCALNKKYDIAVVELGTNHFGEIRRLSEICLPNIGIVTNIGPAHLEYFHSLNGVYREKRMLLRYIQDPYIAILNSDDSLLRKKALDKDRKLKVFGFGIENKSDFFASNINIGREKINFLVNSFYGKEKYNTTGIKLYKKYIFTLKTIGYYNVYNALAAIAAARIFGMKYEDIRSRLAAFEFPHSRLEFINLKNIRFIDDSYNSNPLSLKQALLALENFYAKGRKIFVMGDMLELGKQDKLFHRQAGELAAKVCDVFITVGTFSKVAAQAAKESGLPKNNIFSCDSNLKAREILFKQIIPGPDDIVLVKGSRSIKMEEILKK